MKIIPVALWIATTLAQEPTRFQVRFEGLTRSNTPVSVDVPLRGASPDLIAVTRRGLPVPIHVSDTGTVSWVVRNPAERDYQIEFGGKARFRDYQEPVGIGDSFHYNRPGGFDPLGIGMSSDQPVAIDWDGDGRIDLLQRNLYSYAYGQPWWGIFFWRNVGTNREPRFDHYRRLQADGKYLGDVYNTFQVVDWNRDGLPDLLYGIGGGKQKGTLRVYLNTGRRDADGLPVLTAGPEVSRGGGGDLGYGMRLLDWTGGSKLDLFTLRMRVEYFPRPVVEHTWFRHPGFTGAAQALSLGGQTIYDEWPTDFYDWDGDGDLDAIGLTGDLRSNPPNTCVVVWENTGTRHEPRFSKPPVCAPQIPPRPSSLPTAVKGPAFQGLFLTDMGGWLRYLEQDPGSKAARFTDRGVLTARGQACSSGGYNSTEVADWEGDGDLDFIVGNELGYVQLIENVSRAGRTMFASPRQILLANGEPMRVARWNFLNDGDPEWNLGQSKPTYADWDGDGDLDLLVGNNSNRIAWFENIGTRAQPRFAPMRRLTHDGGDHFSFRHRPVVVDWNGDGLPDLVAGYSGERERLDPDASIVVSLFLRYRGADGKLRLKRPEPFRLEDGSEFRMPIPYRHGFEVADWDGDGNFDLFTNEQGKLYLYRNVGTNSRPLFRKQVLNLYGEPIQISHHETSIKAVDWDHDGTLDLICGAESGWIYFFRRAALDLPHAPRYK